MLFQRDQYYTKKYKKRRILSLLFPKLLTSLINQMYRQKGTHTDLCERVFLCTCEKRKKWTRGSLTAEAAVIVPLFLLAILSLVCVMDLCRVQVTEQAKVSQQAKQLSVCAYGPGEVLTEEYIDLSPVKTYLLPVSLIPKYKVRLAFRGRVHTWTGRSEAECAADKDYTEKEMVYVTDLQSVYHTNGECTHLELAIYKVGVDKVKKQRNEDGKRYKACEKCCSGSACPQECYISARGDRYHVSAECSGLIRKVRMIPKTEVAHLSECIRCRGA